MNNIETYNTLTNVENPVSYAKIGSNAEKIQEFAKYLHKMLPLLEQEFNDLDALNARKPNDIFPIKMQAIASIYQAAKPLYEWYVEKAKRVA